MLSTFSAILPLFLVIGLGAVLRFLRLVPDEWEYAFNQFVLKIGIPFLLFKSFVDGAFYLIGYKDLIVLNIIFLLIVIFFIFILIRFSNISEKMKKTLFISGGFSNVALGIPVAIELYGNEVVSQLGIIISLYFITIFCLGLFYLEYHVHDKNIQTYNKSIWLRVFRNPIIIGVILGIISALAQISFPNEVLRTFDIVAQSVVPLILFSIGIFIGRSSIGKFKDWIFPGVFSITTLVLLPALMFVLGSIVFNNILNTTSLALSILEAAMPLAITPFVLADEYNLDKSFLARSIILSTTLSLITIPGWIYVLGNLNLL